MKIKVIIAEDMLPILNRYKKILEKNVDLEVVAAVQNGYEAVMMAAIHQPDIILMDIEMETKKAGLEAAKQILAQFPNIKIVILTVYEEDELVFLAFKIGVVDYILKNSKPNEIINCVKDAYYDRSPIRHVIAEKIRREFQRVKKTEESFLYNLQTVTQLTPTELDVLDLLSKGHTRKEICEIRHVEPSTIKTQVHSILKKFNKTGIIEVIDTLNELKIFDTLRNLKK